MAQPAHFLLEAVMETQTVGRILVTAKIESLGDLYMVEKGLLPAEQVRSVEVHDALVDTGATIVSMPKRLIDQLGLLPVRTRRAPSSAGSVTLQIYGAVRLTVQGRDCLSDVAEVPDDCPVLIGQVPLELLDFVADCKNHRLIGNPEHGGEHMLDMY
jgi:predicted aspartyl protease